MPTPRLVPYLGFAGCAEEAVDHDAAIFGAIPTRVSRCPAGSRMPEGTVMTVEFGIAGQPRVALNGDVTFPHLPAMPIQIHCADQAEIDRYWQAVLAGGGTKTQCGWINDRYGAPWQIVPGMPVALNGGPDLAAAARAPAAMRHRVTLEIAALWAAAAG